MQVRFWGTRGSYPCPRHDTLIHGGNTSCVEVRTQSGELIILDAGTGICPFGKSLLKEFGEKPIRGNILLSHTHWDHIHGFPFFSPLFFPENEWTIYGPPGAGRSLESVLSGQMQYDYFPVTVSQLGANKSYVELTEGVFRINDVIVRTRFVNHPALTFAYRIEADGCSVVYVPDHEPHYRALGDGIVSLKGQDLDHADFIRGTDLLIHDSQFTAAEYEHRQGWGHSTVEYVADLAALSDVRNLALFHHDPDRSDDQVCEMVETARARMENHTGGHGIESVFAAKEGQAVELALDTSSALNSEVSESRTAFEKRVEFVALAATDAELIASVRGACRELDYVLNEFSDTIQLLKETVEKKPGLILVHDELLCTGNSLATLYELFEGVPIIAIKDTTKKISCAAEIQPLISDWLTWPFSEAFIMSKLNSWCMRVKSSWQHATRSSNESRRVDALRSLNGMDTDTEERFDRLTRLASNLIGVPIAAVSLVDNNRHWFKSISGNGLAETQHDFAFCSYTIQQDDVLIIPDAFEDERFADCPLVTDRRHRFYAGAPLVARNGQKVGALCVIDHRPRILNSSQIQAIRDIASMVEEELLRAEMTAPPQ
ncbi:MAG: GAF domain-containing protein [Planctomycetota bacterium]